MNIRKVPVQLHPESRQVKTSRTYQQMLRAAEDYHVQCHAAPRLALDVVDRLGAFV